eukprot:TRINITY_DN11411_c0_g5_i1.p1 TRINITY_DN11411_c0_g5~~TRINITY_DN11411_c0_g5_i1.p1  ORF type:complete len:179 (+),score=29.52 TRINITY_DN11411_c0_g5_i1:146-682(+)
MSWQYSSTSSVGGSIAGGDLKIESHTWEIDGCGDTTNTVLKYKGDMLWSKQVLELEGFCTAKFSDDGQKMIVKVSKKSGGESTEEIDISQLLFKKGVLATLLTVATNGAGQVECTLTGLNGDNFGKANLGESATVGELKNVLRAELSVGSMDKVALPNGKLLKDLADADSLTSMLEAS